MKHIHYIVLLTLLFVAHTAVAGGITVIHAGWLLAVPGTSPVERQSIIIENDRISRVANGFISRSELGDKGLSARIVDLSQAFVLPGLIDSHVHLASAPEAHSMGNILSQTEADLTLNASYHAQLTLQAGFTTVVDLGSGSGTDSFIAALKVGGEGRVIGIDMTDAQLAKASDLRDRDGFANVVYRKSYIEELPFEVGSVDTVISNGVFNLSADKPAVFREVARILKPGGRLAIADIVTRSQLPETVSCNADLWAACIGGAMQIDDYCAAIEAAGLSVATTQVNDQYGFVSDSAMGATDKWGVQSISLLAVKKG